MRNYNISKFIGIIKLGSSEKLYKLIGNQGYTHKRNWYKV